MGRGCGAGFARNGFLGCRILKTINPGLPPLRSDPRAASRLTSARSFGPPLAPDATKQKAVLSTENQLSQRVMLRVPASIHVALQGKEATFQATTLSVYRQGALLVMERNLPADTRLVLENGRTRECVACRVTRAATEMPEGFHVPIEFDSPAPDFWKIAFPPSDWHPTD